MKKQLLMAAVFALIGFLAAARLIWDFFRHFSRDTETKELRYQ